jgi:hypothetical protein
MTKVNVRKTPTALNHMVTSCVPGCIRSILRAIPREGNRILQVKLGSWPYLVKWRVWEPQRGKWKDISSVTTRFSLLSSRPENGPRPPNDPVSPNVAKSLKPSKFVDTIRGYTKRGCQCRWYAQVRGVMPPVRGNQCELARHECEPRINNVGSGAINVGRMHAPESMIVGSCAFLVMLLQANVLN